MNASAGLFVNQPIIHHGIVTEVPSYERPLAAGPAKNNVNALSPISGQPPSSLEDGEKEGENSK